MLLLHGFPQNHRMWAEVACSLAESYTVVCTDLRGYGDSRADNGPQHDSFARSGATDCGTTTDSTTTPPHAASSFRTMAADQVEVMAALGHRTFAVIGHDRGARTAYRLALDHSDAVSRLGLLDILPTDVVYDTADAALAMAYYHWFFLIQPEPLPEKLIGGDPVLFLRSFLGSYGGTSDAFPAEAIADYERCIRRPETIHAMCEDYRAAATIDLVHDRAEAGRVLDVPALILWGEHGVVGRGDPLTVWGGRLAEVSGRSLDAGHFLVEQQPEEVLDELRAFLAG